MADEPFDALWKTKGGPEIVALHSLFGGSILPAASVREITGLTMEELRIICGAAQEFGLVDVTGEEVSFVDFSQEAGMKARLDGFLSSRADELRKAAAVINSRLLLRFLSSAPGQSA
jgi:hypothetical protein